MKKKFEVTLKFVTEVEVEDSCEHEDAEGYSTHEPNCGKEACREDLMDKATNKVISDVRFSELRLGKDFKSTIEVNER